jgi:hypothetical protein
MKAAQKTSGEVDGHRVVAAGQMRRRPNPRQEQGAVLDVHIDQARSGSSVRPGGEGRRLGLGFLGGDRQLDDHLLTACGRPSDYLGAKTAAEPIPGLQVPAAHAGAQPSGQVHVTIVHE